MNAKWRIVWRNGGYSVDKWKTDVAQRDDPHWVFVAAYWTVEEAEKHIRDAIAEKPKVVALFDENGQRLEA